MYGVGWCALSLAQHLLYFSLAKRRASLNNVKMTDMLLAACHLLCCFSGACACAISWHVWLTVASPCCTLHIPCLPWSLLLLCSPLVQQSKGHLVVGMSDGTLSIKRRPTKSSRSRDVGEEMSLALPSKPFPGTKRFFMRGKAKIEKVSIQ